MMFPYHTPNMSLRVASLLQQLIVVVLVVLIAPRQALAFVCREATPPSRVTPLTLTAVSRRHVLATAAAVSASSSSTATAAASGSSSNANLVADLEMIRLRLPKGGFGREYLAIPLTVQGKGTFEFMVDTGLTTELITPHLQQVLGIDERTGSTIQGLSAGGESINTLVELKDVKLPGNGPTLPVLHAVVTDFPQEHIDPAHDPIEGMIGMEALSLFDVDLDFPNNRLRLYNPGTAPTTGLVEIPAVVINDTGLIGIRIKSLNKKASQQPILGFLDCGAAFSVINSAAAGFLLGINQSQLLDPKYTPQGPTVAGIGIDGRPFPMPTIPASLTFAGKVQLDPTTGKPSGFESPPSSFRPWAPVNLGVGDIPAFSTILGDGKVPYKGPAALIGLDVLAQRRIILTTVQEGNRSRQRSVWVSK